MVQPTFTANIAVYNQLNNLKLILKALEMQTFQDFEIIVCDDGSSDGTKEYMEKEHPDIKYFWQEDIGFRLAKSKNNGIRAAEGRFFVSLEGDVVPHPTLLEEYLKAVDDKTVVLGVRHDVLMWPEEMNFDLFDRYVVQKDFRTPDLERWDEIDRPWRYCSGCNFCIPTKILQEIGGWNENFNNYGIDDYEVCLRLLMAGCRIIPNIKAYGYHLRHNIRQTSDENIKLLADLEAKYESST